MQRKPTNLRVDDGFADHQIAGQHIITITTASSFTIDDGLLSKSAKGMVFDDGLEVDKKIILLLFCLLACLLAYF